MLNKILLKIFGIFDVLKDFLVTWGVKILIALFICVILHNVLKMGEISSKYSGDYKKLFSIYEDDEKSMNIYTVGDGGRTIVILPGFGSQSPALQYKALADELKSDYKVAIVEYFGYGFSMATKKPRTNENIAYEIKKLLEEAGVNGPYILMPHSMSNVYAMSFQNRYPELVDSIISIDGSYPAEVKDKYRLEELRSTVSNVNITSIFELTGFERVLSYVAGDVFYIDKMKSMKDIYTKDDISVYRNRIGSSYLTRTMVREIGKAEDNMNEMKDYVYPSYLPVLQILSSDTIKEYNEAKQSGESTVNLIDLAQNVITNPAVQRIEQIDGDHNLQLTNVTELVSKIRIFLGY